MLANSRLLQAKEQGHSWRLRYTRQRSLLVRAKRLLKLSCPGMFARLAVSFGSLLEGCYLQPILLCKCKRRL
eukprot:3118056-Amphidinium_carterae.1